MAHADYLMKPGLVRIADVWPDPNYLKISRDPLFILKERDDLVAMG